MPSPEQLEKDLERLFLTLAKHNSLVASIKPEERKEIIKELAQTLIKLGPQNNLPLSAAILLRVGQKHGDPRFAALHEDWVKTLNATPKTKEEQKKLDNAILKVKLELEKLCPEKFQQLMTAEKKWREHHANEPNAKNKDLLVLLLELTQLQQAELELNKKEESLFTKTPRPEPKPRHEIEELLERDDVKAILALTGEYKGIIHQTPQIVGTNPYAIVDENPYDVDNDPLAMLDKIVIPGAEMHGDDEAPGLQHQSADAPTSWKPPRPHPPGFKE